MTGMWKKAVQAIPGWLKKYRYAGLVLLLGGLLLMWPAGGLSSGQAASPETSGQAAFDLESLERQMEQALSEIEGVGKVTVVLTLQSDGEQILASDNRQSGEQREDSTVIVSRGSGVQEAVSVARIYPRFRGALVVCDGGNLSAVKLSVLESVSALTGLSSDKISICARK